MQYQKIRASKMLLLCALHVLPSEVLKLLKWKCLVGSEMKAMTAVRVNSIELEYVRLNMFYQLNRGKQGSDELLFLNICDIVYVCKVVT